MCFLRTGRWFREVCERGGIACCFPRSRREPDTLVAVEGLEICVAVAGSSRTCWHAAANVAAFAFLRRAEASLNAVRATPFGQRALTRIGAEVGA